jgi:hypothetical protein
MVCRQPFHNGTGEELPVIRLRFSGRTVCHLPISEFHSQILLAIFAGYGSSIFDPYVNRDHYAGLMELFTPLALVLSLSRLVHGGQRMLSALAAIIMPGSIVLTLSRGGVLSLVAELMFLLWITSRLQKGSVVRNRLLLGMGLTLIFLAFAGSSTIWSHLGDVQETFSLGRIEGLLANVCSQADPRVGIGRVRDRLSCVSKFLHDGLRQRCSQ